MGSEPAQDIGIVFVGPIVAVCVGGLIVFVVVFIEQLVGSVVRVEKDVLAPT